MSELLKNALLNNLHHDLDGFLESQSRSSDRDEAQIAAAVRLRQRCLKKYVVSGEAQSRRAYETFISCNNEVKDSKFELDAEVLGEARDFIYEALRRFTRLNANNPAPQQVWDLGLLISLWKFGPGASNGVQGSHFCEKISQPMTSTSRALPYVRLIRKLTPYLRFYDEASASCGVVEICGSRLTDVPKNEDTARIIGIEPSGNMACQLAVGAYITGALRCMGLDLSTQPGLNKLMAKFASQTGGYICTLDLRSATDLESLTYFEQLWPREWYETMCHLRSPVTELPDGTELELHMMSTMGNGFTFPAMTLTLLALCYAIARKHGCRKYKLNMKRWGVFGDDIICPSEHFAEVVEVLTSVGLSVNTDKSYASGSFFESCGGDFYDGVDITPFYIKDITTEEGVYTAINQVLLWSAKHRIYLLDTLCFLFYILKGPIHFVPEWEDDTSGVRRVSVGRRFTKRMVRQDIKTRKVHTFLESLCILGNYTIADRPQLPRLVELPESGKTGFAVVTPKRSVGAKVRDGIAYLPRSMRVRYSIVKARLPKGFRDGRHPLSWDDVIATRREFLIELAIHL